MKKLLLGFILLLAILMLSFLGYKGIKRQTRLKATEGNFQTMPAFKFVKLNGQSFTSAAIDKAMPAVIIYFSPDCDHCQYEAKEFVRNSAKFNNVSLLMVSAAPVDQINSFYKTYHLDQLHHLEMLSDKDYKFSGYFGSVIYPTIVIYNANGKLKKKYSGEVRIDAILNQLQ